MPWVQLPTNHLLEDLEQLRWGSDSTHSPARDLAALMIYVVFLFVREEHPTEQAPEEESAPTTESLVSMTYDELETAAGLSRSLIRQGLERLTELQLVAARGSRQRREYILPLISGRWAKLPCRAIFKRGEVTPFHALTCRSKHELHALKLYLYLASARDRHLAYAQATYETIHQRLHIQEREIRKSINVLNSCGLLQQVDRGGTAQERFGPNQYYLTGYRDLFPPPSTGRDVDIDLEEVA